MKELDKRIGIKLKNLRTQSGYTMREVADKVGIHFTYVGKIENGKIPNLEILEKLCNVYGIEMSSLFGDGVEVPKQLQDIGVEWVAFAKEMNKENLTPDEIRKIVDFIKTIRKF